VVTAATSKRPTITDIAGLAHPHDRNDPTSSRAMLAARLIRLANTAAAACEIADRAGADLRRHVFRARAGRPVNAGAFLALCGAAGIDPVDGSARSPKRVPAGIAWSLVGEGLRITRRLRREELRSAARHVRLSPATLSRAEAGDALSIESLLAVCRFIGVHPEHYACERVSRETGTETDFVDQKAEKEVAYAK
jgi:hypothetical protein